jgi:Zn-dependent peptidase ImmA (M78 family)
MELDKASYYKEMREFARTKRAEYNVNTALFGLREIRGIYRKESILIDSRKMPSCLKAIYVCIEGDASVAIQKSLPIEPKVFALVHELKHHWFDKQLFNSGLVQCGDYNSNETIEIGAEVFAAEFIYPEVDILDDIRRSGVTKWTAEAIVHFKRNHCRAKVSYTFLKKALERLHFVTPNQFASVQFQKLEESIFGIPFYKQPWFRNRRKAKLSR